MHGEGKVLVYSTVAPEDAARVRVSALVRAWAFHLPQHPTALFAGHVHQGVAPAIPPLVLPAAPAAQVVRAGDNARCYSVGDPRVVHGVADLGSNPDKVTGLYAAFL